MIVYGIKNCDTVKKALNWLNQHQIQYEFHDFKKLGISEDKLSEWAQKTGWENLINKRGTTWKKLDLQVQQGITTDKAAFTLMQEKTSVIKRPIIESNNVLLFGFDEEAFEKQLL
ncbi:ArsC family reductase [Rubrolithibacter danxiaensis]|uniref:ArsC family reductase n=1 Tax=Rubrolithibacter danxiaensis TaxID=3390805 RepID=UPI003BF8BFFC